MACVLEERPRRPEGRGGHCVSNCRLSVVIPTRNGARRLPGCFDALAAMPFDRGRYEIICVDNGSTDATPTVIAQERRRGRLPLRTLREGTRGTSRARNAGATASRGKYLVFLDDDARVVPGFLAAYQAAFGRRNDLLVQGRVMPTFLASRPRWLTDERALLLGQVDEGLNPGSLNGHVNSCNFGIPRKAFNALGGFRTDLGPSGAGMGEDSDLGQRAGRLGLKLVYEPKALVHHLIPRRRTTRSAFLRRCFLSGFCQPMIYEYDELAIRMVLDLAKTSVVRLWSAASATDCAAQMDQFCLLAMHFGRVACILRQKLRG